MLCRVARLAEAAHLETFGFGNEFDLAIECCRVRRACGILCIGRKENRMRIAPLERTTRFREVPDLTNDVPSRWCVTASRSQTPKSTSDALAPKSSWQELPRARPALSVSRRYNPALTNLMFA